MVKKENVEKGAVGKVDRVKKLREEAKARKLKK